MQWVRRREAFPHSLPPVGKLLAIILTLVSLAAIAGLALRPGFVIGVSDGALAESIARATDAREAGKCRGDDERSTCESGGGEYEVKIDDYGCWDATEAGPRRGDPNVPISGCVTVLDLAGIG